MTKQNPNQAILSGDDLKQYKATAQEALVKATESEFLKWSAVWCWFDSGHNTLCPKAMIPAVDDVVAYAADMTDFDIAQIDADIKQVSQFAPAADYQNVTYCLYTRFASPASDDRLQKMIKVIGQYFEIPSKAVPKDLILRLWNNFFGSEKMLFQVYKTWLEARENGFNGEWPFARLIRAWQNRPRKPEKASVDVVGSSLTVLPYGVSEVSRTRWEAIDGSIDAVMVDGQPLATHIPDFKTRARGGNLKAYKPQNTQGQLTLGFSFERKPLAQPIPLIAYSEFGGDLHKSIAADVSVLLFLTHASNQSLFLSHKDGARLLARNRQGGFRKKINRQDKQRFIDAWVAVWSMMVWIERNGLFIPYDMAICSRINDETVTLSKPLWSRRENGQWTLTAGYGAVGKNRLFGKIDDGGIWRTIAGIEYHLARGYPTIRGKNKGIAQPLVAASKGGPGEWQKVDWRTFMRLTGDNWAENDKAKDSTVNRRFGRRKEVLKAAGYVTDGRNPATAGDTVEFSFGKKGVAWFRATDRFVEAARLAKEQKWETVNLQSFLNGN